MSIFKAITICYCEKIFNLYKQQTGEKLYTGYEAELVVQRNEFARCLIAEIKKINVNDNDYPAYFKKVLETIDSTLREVKVAVAEYNKENKTKFTTDLFESSLTPNLISYVTMLENLFRNSPEFVKNIADESLFTSSRDIPWVNQFSFILYEYILEKEFEIITDKIGRDIFDSKIQLIQKYIGRAAAIATDYKDEKDEKYQDLMKMLLKSMCSEEHGLQYRTTEPSSPNSSTLTALTSLWYKTSEKVIGKSILGQKIETLIQEFNERPAMQILPHG